MTSSQALVSDRMGEKRSQGWRRSSVGWVSLLPAVLDEGTAVSYPTVVMKNTPAKAEAFFMAERVGLNAPGSAGLHENLRVFVRFPRHVKTPVFTLSRSNPTIGP
jgi:hypothetical protein